VSRFSLRRADAFALLVLAALVALAVGNRLAFDAWLTRFDLFTFFLPWYAFLGERLRELAVPGWNPHLFSGAPFAGDPESGWMYLPAMLAFALLPAIAAFKAMVAVQIGVAALTTYAFARVLGMGALAALTAATVYALGPLLHWNTYCCLIFGQFAPWIPLAFLGIELVLLAGTWRGRIAAGFLGGFAVSQMFAGWGGEGWLYAVLLPAAYAGYRGILDPPRPTRSIATRFVSGAATAIAVPALGMTLGAAGILPRLVVNAETNLAGGDYRRLGEAGVLNPPWTLDYLLAQILGEGSGYHVRAAALGGAVFVLSALAVVLVWRRYAAPFFALLTLTAWLLTLETTPVHQLFYLIPRYREFHDHDAWRTIALSAIGPAMLSGAAIDALPRWRGRWRLLPVVAAPLVILLVVAWVLRRQGMALGWAPLVAAAVATGLVAVVVLWPHFPPGKALTPTPKHPHPNPSPIAMGEGLPADERGCHNDRRGLATPPDVNTPSPRARGEGRGEGQRHAKTRFILATQTLLLTLVVLQPTGLELSGSWLGWPRSEYWEQRWHPDPAAMPALMHETGPRDPNGVGQFLQAQLARAGPFRYAGYGGVGYPGDAAREASYMARRFDPAVQALLVNGRPIFLGLYTTQGYNPLQLQRYVEFITALNGAPQDYHTAFLLPDGIASPLLDLLAVRYLVIDAALPPARADVAALTAGRREVFRTADAIVYARDPAPPHAWVVHDVREVARGEALPLLTSGAVDPWRTALVEGTPSEVRQPPPGAAESARVTHYGPDRLAIATDAAAPGLLVVSEVFASGWRAYIDGRQAPILPTHHALRGVPLPAGEHTVELRYEPWPLRLGLAISAIAVVAMLVSFLAVAWPRRTARL
jgi:hypothetical protein